jgi:hypothetical protein
MRLLQLLALALAALIPAAATAAPGPLQLSVFANTGVRLTDVVWTGTQFLYVENTTNAVYAAPPQGTPSRAFASMPRVVEETRCRLSPGAHGFPAGDVYCHAPDNAIYRIGPDGSVVPFARLPDDTRSDGAMDFDRVGRFGYALVVATGTSGAAEPAGGDVYAVSAAGAIRRVGAYPGPGGADGLVVAPATFGTGAGQAVLTVDAGAFGQLVVMDPQGRTRTIASLPAGPDPIAYIASPAKRAPAAPRGLYLTDTTTTDVFLLPAAQLKPYAGDLIVASEIKGWLWVVRPRANGKGLQTVRLAATLPPPAPTGYDLEGATYVP